MKGEWLLIVAIVAITARFVIGRFCHRANVTDPQFVQHVLHSGPNAEALTRLQSGKCTLGELPTTGASIALIEEVDSLGATLVMAVKNDRYDTGEENTGRLIVTAPKRTRAAGEGLCVVRQDR